MFGTLLFWFIWLVGFFVVTAVVSGSVYVAIDKKRRDNVTRVYHIAKALQTQTQQRKPTEETQPPPPKSPTVVMQPPPTQFFNKKEN